MVGVYHTFHGSLYTFSTWMIVLVWVHFCPIVSSRSDMKSHGMRNEITVSKRCCVSQPHKQFRFYCLLVDSFRKFRLIVESVHSTKDGLELFHLMCPARCVSCGQIRVIPLVTHTHILACWQQPVLLNDWSK
jgi:hypothetical protein